MIYFGSTHQYGNIKKISEGGNFQPLDYQSISKCSSEYFFKKSSFDLKFKLLILRFPNVYGYNQKTQHEDQGLLINLINQAKFQKKIVLFLKQLPLLHSRYLLIHSQEFLKYFL